MTEKSVLQRERLTNGKSQFRKSNLNKLLEHNLVIFGPSISAEGSVFYFEGADEDYEDEFKPIPVIDFDTEIGEIF